MTSSVQGDQTVSGALDVSGTATFDGDVKTNQAFWAGSGGLLSNYVHIDAAMDADGGPFTFTALTRLVGDTEAARLRAGDAFKESSTWLTPADERAQLDPVEADYAACATALKALPLKSFRWDTSVLRSVATPGGNPYFGGDWAGWGNGGGGAPVLGWAAGDVSGVLPNAVRTRDEYGDLTGFAWMDSDQVVKTMYGALRWCIARIEALEAAAPPP